MVTLRRLVPVGHSSARNLGRSNQSTPGISKYDEVAYYPRCKSIQA